mgnify:CR=1 FL=1
MTTIHKLQNFFLSNIKSIYLGVGQQILFLQSELDEKMNCLNLDFKKISPEHADKELRLLI